MLLCRLSVRQVVVGCHQLASALAATHSKGIVHQDVRPHNIMDTMDGSTWKLVDFGNALLSVEDGKQTWSQTIW